MKAGTLYEAFVPSIFIREVLSENAPELAAARVANLQFLLRYSNAGTRVMYQKPSPTITL
jgi:hypothetical protein